MTEAGPDPQRDPDAPVGTPPPGAPGGGTDTEWVLRSEERARVAFPTRVRGRVRLVKHVVTEEVTHTFTLRREELRVEEVPGDEPGADLSWTYRLPEGPGPDLEIVLHAEQVVASTVTVPVERVRVGTRVVETEVLVSTDVRREQLEVVTTQDAGPDGPGATDHPYDQQPGAQDGAPGTPEEEPA